MKHFFLVPFVTALIFCASCSNNIKSDAVSAKDSTDPYRPLFHFSPDSNWINDPNGLVYANGKYHLFFQYNPFGSKWGHMSWGHAVSTDLLSWKEMPVAIKETIGSDSVANMIFSGSAVVDSFNTSGFGKDGQVPMVAIYTAHKDKAGKGIGQAESLAYSLDEGKTWQEYEGNPVLDIHITDFRDPKVFWYAPEKKWVMAVVKALEYKVQFYASANLKTWTLLSEFGGMGNTDKIWECPDLFQLPVEGSNEKKWVLTVSAGHPQKGYLAMQYFVGDFDGKTFTPDKLAYPLYIDYGKDYYAGITYNNIPAADGRTIMIGWANSWIYARDIPTGNVWRGMYALPRKLSLVKTGNADYALKQEPVAEYDALKEAAFSLENKVVDSVFDLSFHSSSFELDVVFEPGEAKACGVKVLKSKNEATILKYDNSLKMLSLDRTRSGNVNFNEKFPSIETANLLPVNGAVTLRIIVDKSMVEIFANNGLVAMTDLVFPLENAGGIELFSEEGKTIFKSVKAYTIKPLK